MQWLGVPHGSLRSLIPGDLTLPFDVYGQLVHTLCTDSIQTKHPYV